MMMMMMSIIIIINTLHTSVTNKARKVIANNYIDNDIVSNLLTSLAVQFYLSFCSKSGTLAAWLASCQCL